MTAPPAGTVSGTVTLTANAADNVGVSGVQFLVDNAAQGAEDTTSPYSTSWNTTTAANGTHTLTVRARDAAGNITTSAPVTVTVANPAGGFTKTTLVSGLSSPTDFRFTPDGSRIFIAQKNGMIQVANAQTGALQTVGGTVTPLITLPTDPTGTRGLLGIAVDPQYGTAGHNYVYAVRTTAPDPISGIYYEEISRVQVTDPNAAVLTASLATEQVLVMGDQPGTSDHFGGGIALGPDGMLYVSTGDNRCCSVVDGHNSQDLTNMYGKVLRMNPDGSAPTDNPFYTPGGDPDTNLIYAYGFRNAFRLNFTPTGQLLVGDVGQATWEEVDNVVAGGNYGWPIAEGPCDGIGVKSCSTPPTGIAPSYAYLHDPSGGNSITSVMVYTVRERRAQTPPS